MNELNIYKEALTSTSEGWPDIGVGFTGKETAQNLTTISRQLNTVLHTVISLRKEVAELRQEIKRIGTQSPEISELSKQLDKVHLSAKGVAFKENKGTIKVYKNPFELLKNIK